MANLYGTAKRFFIFAGIIILTSFASVGLGSVISVLADSPDQAQALQIPILLPLMIFGGFFLNNRYIINRVSTRKKEPIVWHVLDLVKSGSIGSNISVGFTMVMSPQLSISGVM